LLEGLLAMSFVNVPPETKCGTQQYLVPVTVDSTQLQPGPYPGEAVEGKFDGERSLQARARSIEGV
jgi:hypothetical protein